MGRSVWMADLGTKKPPEATEWRIRGGGRPQRRIDIQASRGQDRYTKKPWREYAAELRSQVKEVKTRPPWSYGKTPEWASQSYRLALSHAYDAPKDGKLPEGENYDVEIVVVAVHRSRWSEAQQKPQTLGGC